MHAKTYPKTATVERTNLGMNHEKIKIYPEPNLIDFGLQSLRGSRAPIALASGI